MKYASRNLAALLLLPVVGPTSLLAQTLSAGVDPALSGQISTAAKTAESEGNFTTALREEKRLLELYPNEPGLQAPVYLVMSVYADKAGEADQAKLYASISNTLDPKLTADAASAKPPAGTVTRGGPGSKTDTMLAFAQAALGVYVAVRAARNQGQPQQQQYQGGPQDQSGQQGGGSGQGTYNYPQSSYGQPGYQPPPQGQYQPPPGYSDPGQQQQGGYPQQQPQGGYPQQQQGGYPQQQQGGHPEQQQPQGGYPQQQQGGYPQQQQGGYPQQQQAQGAYPQQQPQGGYPQQQQSGYPQQQQQGGYYPPPPQNPYGAPANYSPAPTTRGEKAQVYKVVQDRARLGDKTFFQNGCGTLLTTDTNNLVVTPGCGERPLLIPAADIWEVRLNTTVGKDIGAYHIITRKGLYLDLAPSTGSRDEARTQVDALRKSLGLEK